jgi:MFS family permease
MTSSLVVPEQSEEEIEVKEEKRIKFCGLWLNEGVCRRNLFGYFMLSFTAAFAMGVGIIFLPQLLVQKLGLSE